MHPRHTQPAAAGAVSLPRLPLMSWCDQPVVTTDMLARCYGTDQRRIRKNFERNRERFIEGKHVFRVEGAALAEFRERLKDALKIAPNIRVLNLWTERGAARHAKMLDTDQAWDVFEALEDTYFRRSGAYAHPQIDADPLARIAATPGVLTPASLQAMLDKPMQITTTMREWLALTQQVVKPGISMHSCGQHYSDDLRAEVLGLGDKGWMPAEISERTGVPRDTVSTMLFRARKAGKIAKGPRQGILRRERKAKAVQQ